MTDTTNTPTPETDSAEAMVEQTDYSNTGRGQERQRKEAAWEYARSLETRLAAEAKAPKVWDAETIKGAPEGFYYYHWKEGSPNGEGWAELWQSNNPDVETLDFVRENLLDGRHVDAAFGPIPQPPTPPVTNKGNPHA